MILFSADDYGYSRQGSEHILNCNQKQSIIKNTSILSNFASSEDLNQIKSSAITKGIHLNLIEGKPLGSHKTLIDENGIFLSKSKLFNKILKNKVDACEIYNEILLQLEFILDSGIVITYADSHQNTHFIPQIMCQYEKALKKYNINKVRGQSPIYSWFSDSFELKANFHKSLAYVWNLFYTRSLITSNKIILKAPGMGLKVKDVDEALSLWSSALKMHNENVVYEVPCHLDYSELEFQLYSSPEFSKLLIENKIKTCSYGEL